MAVVEWSVGDLVTVVRGKHEGHSGEVVRVSKCYLWIMGGPRSVTKQSRKISCEPMDEATEVSGSGESSKDMRGGSGGGTAQGGELPGLAWLDVAARAVVREACEGGAVSTDERVNRGTIRTWMRLFEDRLTAYMDDAVDTGPGERVWAEAMDVGSGYRRGPSRASWRG